jgi:hypothetical protein
MQCDRMAIKEESELSRISDRVSIMMYIDLLTIHRDGGPEATSTRKARDHVIMNLLVSTKATTFVAC